MGKLKKIFTNVRIIILLVFLLFSLVAINPNIMPEGVAIRGIEKNTVAAEAMDSPKANILPRSREIILSVNNQQVNSEEEYYSIIDDFGPNRTIRIKTSKGSYTLVTREMFETIYLNETEQVKITEELFNQTTNETTNVTRYETRQKSEQRSLGVEPLGIVVYPVPTNNIRKGLDLQGGTRVLLEPEKQVNLEDLDLIIQNIKQRVNVYGLSDVIVRAVKDFSGKNFILVEVSGANDEEVKDLISSQGKFEAKINNETVFVGGKDIKYVCRSAECSGIARQGGCAPSTAGGWQCEFAFSITLDPEAAQRQADATKDLDVYTDENGQSYLESQIELYLDDELVDQLNIGADLKGRAVTDIQISGGGAGETQQEAISDALQSMKRLQTIMITGSLPVKLDIVKVDSISPMLGEEFIDNALLIGLLAILAVVVVVSIRYKRFTIAIPMAITMLSEVFILLGVASLIGWNLDLAAIAGIIIAVGTGVDHQIVITDETLGRKRNVELGWKEKLKKAFFIITAAYLTTLVAMVPLMFAGAGLLKGFAITTIIGVSIGVIITRPAFGSMIQILLKKH